MRTDNPVLDMLGLIFLFDTYVVDIIWVNIRV